MSGHRETEPVSHLLKAATVEIAAEQIRRRQSKQAYQEQVRKQRDPKFKKSGQ
jgi:hypothetical protein